MPLKMIANRNRNRKRFVRRNGGTRTGYINRRRGNANNFTVNDNQVIRNLTLLPQRFYTKLVYDSGDVGTTTTILMGSYQFRCNSLFDPDLTGIGHQPRGFDQLSALYNDYLVYAVKVLVNASVKTASATGVVAIGHHSTQTNNVTNLNDVMESRNIRYRQIVREKPFQLKWYIPMAKIFGLSKRQYAYEKGFSAGTGANPTNGGAINVMWQGLDEVSSVDFDIRVRLTYFCAFSGPKDVAQS